LRAASQDKSEIPRGGTDDQEKSSVAGRHGPKQKLAAAALVACNQRPAAFADPLGVFALDGSPGDNIGAPV
jgi:hypothetical protein